MSFSPADSVLFELDDTAKNLNYLLSYAISSENEATTEVLSYEYSIDRDDHPFEIKVTNDGVTVIAASLESVFVPQYIKYWDDYQVYSVSNWSEVPLEKKIIEFKPSLLNRVDYQITVLATVKNTYTLPQINTYSKTWILTIYHNYDADAEALTEYMNVSSS